MSTYVQAEKLFQIAVLLPCATFIGWLIGSWLDGRFHQRWISIVGLLVGGIAGLVYVIRLAIAASKEAGREDR